MQADLQGFKATNLNPRLQNKGDEKVWAVDVNLIGMTDASMLGVISQGDDLFTDEDEAQKAIDHFKQMFWDGKGVPMDLKLKAPHKFTAGATFRGLRLKLYTFASDPGANDNIMEFSNMSIGKFEFTPKLDWRCELSLQLQGECDDEQWAWLKPALRREILNVLIAGVTHSEAEGEAQKAAA